VGEEGEGVLGCGGAVGESLVSDVGAERGYEDDEESRCVDGLLVQGLGFGLGLRGSPFTEKLLK
jgi:hypothetical protein